MPPVSRYEDLAPADLQQVNAACDRFEAALKNGDPARAEDWAGDGPLRDVLLAEFLLLECEYAIRGRRPLDPDDLDRRFPDRTEFLRHTVERARGYAGLHETHPAAPPRHLGRFLVRRRIGHGGFGVVYLAYDPHLKRDVAVKVPHPHRSDPKATKQFEAEAVRMAGLDHPNLVPVYEAGLSDGHLYLVTAYVEGPNLADWLKARLAAGRPVSPPAAARLVRDVADAVDVVHRSGSLHCDIKPANILLAGGDQGVPRLTDFGLSRLIDGAGDTVTSGLFAGTPLYMAPEQALGRPDRVSVATDVYALGAVLYELLAGRPVVANGAFAEVVRQIVEGTPPPLRGRRPDAPGDLAAVCGKCLEKDPARRYRAARELVEDLDRFLAGVPVEAALPGVWRRLGSRVRRHRFASALAAVAAAAVVAAVAGLAAHTSQLNALNTDLQAAQHAILQEQRERAAEETARRVESYPDQIRMADLALTRWDRATARRILDGVAPDAGAGGALRGFEWRHLHARAADPPGVILASVGKPVYTVDVSPDGRLVAFGGADGTVRVVHADGGAPAAGPWPHPADVDQVAFAPDGRSVAVACADRAVRVWDLATGRGRVVTTLPGRPHAVAFAPGGEWLAVGGDDPAVTVLDLTARNRPARALARPGFHVRNLSFDPAGRRVVFGTRDAGAWVWRPWADEPPAAVPGDLLHIGATRFTPDGDSVVIGPRQSYVPVVQSLRGESGPPRELRDAATPPERINDFGWSPAGRRLAVARETGVEVWDWPARVKRLTLPAYGTRAYGVRFVTEDDLALAFADGTVRRCRVADDDAIRHVDFPGSVQGVAFAPDGTTLLLAEANAVAQPFLALAGRAPARPGAVEHVAFGASSHGVHTAGEEFRAFGSDGRLHRLTPAGKPLGGPRLENIAEIGRPGVAPATALSRSGRFFCAAISPNVALWDAATGRLKLHVVEERSDVQAVAMAGDALVACGGRDAVIRIRRAEDGRETAALVGHTRIVRGLCFTADGARLVSCGWDRTVRVWSVADGVCLHTLTGHGGPVHCVAVSPDGRTVASGGDDGRVRLWHLATGRELLTIPTGAAIRAIAFDPTGRRLAIGSGLLPESRMTRLTVVTADPPE